MKRHTVVIKLGSSSVVKQNYDIDTRLINNIAGQISTLKEKGDKIVVVSSGAVASGLRILGKARGRYDDPVLLQAASSVGQSNLMYSYQKCFSKHGLTVGQVLLTPIDLTLRTQYLHAKETLEKLLSLGVVPIVNENDAVADDEIRMSDNDRLAALVANLVRADLLCLLTDTDGLFDFDPRKNEQASLIEEVEEVDRGFEKIETGPGSEIGSGGMATKLIAAKMASWAGTAVFIGNARRKDVVCRALKSEKGIGTFIKARADRLSARKLWIAFAIAPKGSIVVDPGAYRAIKQDGKSLLAVGIKNVVGEFQPGDGVEILGPKSELIAKGIVSVSAFELAQAMLDGKPKLKELGNVVHRDDLVVLG